MASLINKAKEMAGLSENSQAPPSYQDNTTAHHDATHMNQENMSQDTKLPGFKSMVDNVAHTTRTSNNEILHKIDPHVNDHKSLVRCRYP